MKRKIHSVFGWDSSGFAVVEIETPLRAAALLFETMFPDTIQPYHTNDHTLLTR